MSWIPSLRRLALPLVLALLAFAAALYFTCRPGVQAVQSVLRHEPPNLGPGEGPFWHSAPSYVATNFGGQPYGRNLDIIPLRACEARNVFAARTDLDDERAPVVLNLLADGRVVLRGKEYPLPDDEEADEGARREARWSLRALGAELDTLARDPPRPQGMLLNVDCSVSWRHLRTVLPLIRSRPWARDPMGWVVARPPYGTGLELRAVLGTLEADRPRADELSLSMAGTYGSGVEVGLLGQTFRFPPRALPSDEPTDSDLAACNRVWGEIAHRLEGVPIGQRAVLRTGLDASAVPLAYFITLFDLLIGRRLLQVDLPDEGLVLRLVPPPASLAEQHPPPSNPEAVFPWWICALTLAGMVAALQVSLRRG